MCRLSFQCALPDPLLSLHVWPQPVQVVVDSEQTAKALLANGQLRQRVTIIPLNKCVCRPG